MVELLVEPSVLSFDLVKNADFNELEENNEIDKFKFFTKQLIKMFDEFKENDVYISVTKDIVGFYQSSIPVIAYEGSHPIMKLAVELFSKKIWEVCKVIQRTDHDMDVVFEDEGICDIELNSSEVYQQWIKVVSLVFSNRLPPWVFKSNVRTIFSSNIINISMGAMKEVELFSSCDLKEIVSSKEVQRIVLASKMIFSSVENIICKGTGTHSSMWNNKIRNLLDVPTFERELFERLINTRLIKEITFLSFEKNYQSVSSPKLIINNVSSHDKSDIMYCTLRGQGKKQHAQEVKITLTKGAGNLFRNVCEKEITIENVASLIEIIAAAGLEE